MQKKTLVWLVLFHLTQHFPLCLLPDRLCLDIAFKAYQGYFPNLDAPKTYNEKLQWLKLYDRKELYTVLSDKYLVREYVSKKIGEQYLIPLLGVWDTPQEIPYDKMPKQFVLKCNHDSGSVVICHNKNTLDIEQTNKKLSKALKRKYYLKSREYNYKNINKKIVAEMLMHDQKDKELTDYKFFCFNGVPKFIQVDTGRFSDHVRNFYTTGWDFIDVQYGCKNDRNRILPKPHKLDEMLKLSRILSEELLHVRVDFYISNGKVYFGELTFHHGGGFMQLKPFEYDIEWGKYLTIASNRK